MIKTIQLENFQSHKDTTFSFTGGVNAITGHSDAGKTACIRALRWVLTNRPSGDTFANHDVFVDGKQKLAVSVTVTTDAHRVKRTKSATENSYTVDDKMFKAIGADVPEEVVQALNLNELSVQFQMDAPFLLTETSGEVARILNKVVKLDDIDSTLKQLESHRRKVKREKETYAYEITDLEERLDALDYTQAQTTVEVAEMLVEARDSIETQVEGLGTLLKEYHTIEALLSSEEGIEHCYNQICEGTEILQSLHTLEQQESTLQFLHDTLEEIDELLDTHQFVLDIPVADIQTTVEEYKQVQADINTMRILISQYTDLYDNPIATIDVQRYEEALQKYTALQLEIQHMHTDIETLGEYTRVIARQEEHVKSLTKELGKTCPLCGGKL